MGYVFWGLILSMLFNGVLGAILDVAAAALVFWGMLQLSAENAVFRQGKNAAILLLVSRVLMVGTEFLDENGAFYLIVSLILMVPEVMSQVIVMYNLGDGVCKIEREYEVPLGGDVLYKRAKMYSMAAVTMLLATVFSMMGMLANSSLIFIGGLLLLVSGIFGMVVIIMYLVQLYRTNRKYLEWKAGVPFVDVPEDDEMNYGSVESLESGDSFDHSAESDASENLSPEEPEQDIEPEPMAENGNVKTIYLAGGCFWGAEKYLSLVPGVVSTQVGYANGVTENPSYEDVKYRNSGHAETVKVDYDQEKISLERLLEKYFEVIDPVSVDQQGGDIGKQYRTGIYYTDSGDLPTIQAVYDRVAADYDKPLAVEVQPLRQYYEAEDYHQKYLDKNPLGYCHIDGCMFEKAKEL